METIKTNRIISMILATALAVTAVFGGFISEVHASTTDAEKAYKAAKTSYNKSVKKTKKAKKSYAAAKKSAEATARAFRTRKPAKKVIKMAKKALKKCKKAKKDITAAQKSLRVTADKCSYAVKVAVNDEDKACIKKAETLLEKTQLLYDQTKQQTDGTENYITLLKYVLKYLK